MSCARGKTVTDAEFRRLWMDKRLSTADIGALLGISATAVGIRAKARRLPPRVKGSHPQRIDRDLMVAMWRDNVGLAELAGHFGRSVDAIVKWFRARGMTRTCHRGNLLTVAQWQELQVARRMAEAARVTQAAMREAQMVDARAGRPKVAA